jgi:hypothetical protein
MLNNIIFLSHSSKTPEALADVDQLRTRLIQAGFEVRLDFRTILGGEDWNFEIDQWMSECGAAVILLSPAALASDWVLTEARILQWRRQFDPHLKIVPVTIDGVTKAQYLGSKRHELLKLNVLQILEAPTAEASAAGVLQALGPPVPAVPSELQRATDKIAAQLARMSELDFSNTFAQLGMDFPPWRPNSQHSKAMARALAQQFLKMNVYEVDRIVDALGGAVDAQAKDSICRVLSAFWVREEAAKPITAATLKQPGCGSVALNGKYLLEFTADAYVRRAFWPDEKWRIIRVEGGAGTDAVRHVADSILRGASLLNPNNTEEWLRRTKLPLLVLLPDRSLLDSQGLAQLRLQFPRVTFMLGTGETLLDLASEGYTGLTYLQPPLDVSDEEKARWAFSDAMVLLSGS